MTVASKAKLISRLMTDCDIPSAARLLSRGFPERREDYWLAGLARMSNHALPEGHPRFGYVLESAGELVGIVLLIVAETDNGDVRANISSWYVEQAFRAYANMLLAPALRMAGVTLFNISPSPGTIPTIEAQGFKRYVDGSFQSLAALSRPIRGALVRTVAAGDITAPEPLRRLASQGCLCYVVSRDGKDFPFAFKPTRAFGERLPSVQLVYCLAVTDLVRFAGPLGRRLLLRGRLFVTIDANGPLAGLWGRYFPGRRPKYYRGNNGAPRLGDLSESELVMFGP